ncbi:MAG: DUF2723 domain-containing protein [Gemmatimonadota bacterium]|nr:DUF2723 domain-containing protein [Gemmatimonadota bacterium]
MDAARLALGVYAILFAVYVASLAPTVTFWDAGELIAAVHSFGIPHPPGTPLFVLVARAWSDILGWLPRATATNLLSAACTAGAAAITARWLARVPGARWHALGAAVCAGAASTIWLNATETELYAPSLLLAWLAIVAADRSGRTGEGRWLAVSAYALALAVPLHMSALVATPAAVVLAAQSEGRGNGARWGDGVTLGAAAVFAIGVGTVSGPVILASLGAFGAAAWLQPRGRRRVVVAVGALTLLAFSCLGVLPLRAVYDPVLNTGNPVTWDALVDLIGRGQYGGHRLWPRQAPLWIQLGNIFEYLDWQFALGLAPGVAPAAGRTTVTVAYAALGVYGSAAHRRCDRRSWRALALLFAFGSVGLAAYMNFKAGASFAYQFVPDAAAHEARERDYFFALAFWTWGAWAGYGAVAMAERLQPRLAPAGVFIAALPIALNWSAVDRRAGADARLAHTTAEALLWSAPPRAVLIAGGDNDAFPLWYLQTVEGARGDVTVVVAPLLGARWYREELARRDGLLTDSAVVAEWRGERPTLVGVATGAARAGRPVAVAVSAGSARSDLIPVGRRTLRGVVYVEDESRGNPFHTRLRAYLDTSAAAAFTARYGSAAAPLVAVDAIDPAPRVMRRMLGCPGWAAATVVGAAAAGAEAAADSLDHPCNFR